MEQIVEGGRFIPQEVKETVHVPVLQIQEIVETVIPQEHFSERVVEQIGDMLVPQVVEEIADLPSGAHSADCRLFRAALGRVHLEADGGCGSATGHMKN